MLQSSKPYHVLITRPEPQCRDLANALKQVGYKSICQPFFSYQAHQSIEKLQKLLNEHSEPWLIFVSVSAVNFALKTLPICHWQASKIFAIGNATKKALELNGCTDVISPIRQDSEGLLKLADFNEDVKDKSIIIIRGDGGRELIANTLTSRGANVHYFESYQRIWTKFDEGDVVSWRKININCIVITSNALLESVVQLLLNQSEHDSYWQYNCLWVVASNRIAEQAKRLGIKHVVCAEGANDNAILAALSKME